jgi:hypothetical protein
VRLDCGMCAVRDWEYADKTSLVRHANNNKVWRNLLDRFPHPYTEADAESWFALVGTLSPRYCTLASDSHSTTGDTRQLIALTLRWRRYCTRDGQRLSCHA